MTRYRVGVDVGGTFTDLVGLDLQTGALETRKVFTTPEDESVGTLAAIAELTGDIGEMAWFGHGFTVGLNAILTRSGAKTGLLCTRGHRDILDMGRMYRPWGPDLYNPTWMRPHVARPLVERRHRRGIPERVLFDGSVLLALDEEALRREVAFLREEGVESVAICFLNAYVNQEHEQRAAAVVRELLPEAYVQTSAIYPVVREAERTVTVALDAYCGPRVDRYLRGLEQRLREAGWTGEVEIMQMHGGYLPAAATRTRPVYTIISGPVAGVLGAEYYARHFDLPNLICCDMGGTSTDVGLVVEGKAWVQSQFDVEHGLTLMIPSVGIRSIGAGGGSLISIDQAGALRVGPESAGSRPGPACYGRGGTRPTLTDAYLVCGVLRPDLFLGGRVPLDADAARWALHSVAAELGMREEALAEGAIQLAHANMAEAVRAVTIYRGLDIREFALLAYGAAGGMAAADIAANLGVREVLVPREPGAFCAFGTICADVRFDASESVLQPLHPGTADRLEATYQRLEQRARDAIVSQGARPEEVRLERVYFGMYDGQTWDNRISAPPGPYTADTIVAMQEEFHRIYLQTYGYNARELPIMVSTAAVVAMGPPPPIRLPEVEAVPAGDPVVARGTLHWHGRAYDAVPYLARERLPVGEPIPGPAVVVEPFSTTLVRPGDLLWRDSHGILHIRVHDV